MKYKFLEKLGLVFLAANVKTIDGQPLFISDLAEGGLVEIMVDGEKVPMPKGNWELDNGKTIITDEAGKIVDVMDTVPVDENAPAEGNETVVEDAPVAEDAPESETIDAPAAAVVEEVSDVVENVVDAVVTESTDVNEVVSLKEKVAELEAKLAEAMAKLDEKAKELELSKEEIIAETTVGNIKKVNFQAQDKQYSEADKQKFWYKKMMGLV